jgi:diguanylate cyclase (GGDEF)-like protein
MVEDDPADARLLEETLRESQHPVFHCRVAPTLKEALQALAAEPFDLILSDLNLPDAQGLETYFRVQKAAPDTPVLVITGNSDREAGSRAVHSGAQDYLVKGWVMPDHLVQAARFALERHRQRSRLERKAERLERDKDSLLELARTDPLTELANRRGLQEAWERSHLSASEGMKVILVDVDDFKRVNDLLGHDVGDLVLQTIASRLKAALRSTDFASRIGGDEFLALLPQASAQEAAAVAERIREDIAGRPVQLPSGPFKVTVSLGVVSVPTTCQGLEDLLAVTHHSLYRSKHEGKNRVTLEAGLEGA